MLHPSDAGSARAGAFWIAAILVVGIGACEEKKSAEADASAAARASADASASASASAGASADAGGAGMSAHGGALPICRIMTGEGGPSPSSDATRWLDLPGTASFTVRRLETGRELRFEGPGRVRACADDVALVAEGSAIGLPGSGEAPGAEQWVATACGAVRWASGVHRITGGRTACRLQSSLGTVQLYVPDDVTATEVPFPVDGGAPATDGGASGAAAATSAGGARATAAGAAAKSSPWRRIDGRRAFTLVPRATVDGEAAVKSSLAACDRAADAVQTLGIAMLTGARPGDAGADGSTPTAAGDLAEQSVVARGVARAACSVAAVRVALAGGKPVDEARLAAASIRWRGSR